MERERAVLNKNLHSVAGDATSMGRPFYPESMSRISPTWEGFRAAFRFPSLTFGEIVWRWSFGATTVALLLFGFFEYLGTLPVTSGELLFLRTRHPFLVVQAVAHILRGSLYRAVISLLVAALMLLLFWMLASSVGRVATVRVLQDHFRTRFPEWNDVLNEGEHAHDQDPSLQAWTGVVRLNFLRVGVLLAAIVACGGAAVLAGMASPKNNFQPGVSFLLFVPMAGLIFLVGWALNWFLSLAGIFAVRDGDSAVNAILDAATFCRERTGAVFAVSTWTGIAHLVVFSAATTVVAVPLGASGLLPGRLVALCVLLVTLGYFAFADWLFMARLAGYVCISETPEALLKPLPPMPPFSGAPLVVGTPLQTTIDRDELILSDVPGPLGT
jgi:hypothetical protein